MKSYRLTLESLESRDLLSAVAPPSHLLGGAIHPVVHVAGGTDASPGYTGAELRAAYGLRAVTGPQAGAGMTVACVVVGDNPEINWDLHQFDLANHLPDVPVFRKLPDGLSNTPPSFTIDPGWGLEAALDVQTAHAAAPAARIVLVEAASADALDMLNAAVYAARFASVVSMSWGSSESGDLGILDSTKTLYVASAGDSPGGLNDPSADPSVLAVGGSNVQTSASGRWQSETAWVDSPFGLSQVYPHRYVPDVSGPGARDSAIQIWVGGAPAGYLPHDNPVHAYGTSESAPWVAGEFADIEAVSHVRFSASGVVTSSFLNVAVERGPSARAWLAAHRDAEHRFPRGGYGSLDMTVALRDARPHAVPSLDLPPEMGTHGAVRGTPPTW